MGGRGALALTGQAGQLGVPRLSGLPLAAERLIEVCYPPLAPAGPGPAALHLPQHPLLRWMGEGAAVLLQNCLCQRFKPGPSTSTSHCQSLHAQGAGGTGGGA